MRDRPGWFRRTRPDVLHVHAGIGSEGHAHSCLPLPTLRTEHLPRLITDERQRAGTVAMIARVEAVPTVPQASRDGLRRTPRAWPHFLQIVFEQAV